MPWGGGGGGGSDSVARAGVIALKKTDFKSAKQKGTSQVLEVTRTNGSKYELDMSWVGADGQMHFVARADTTSGVPTGAEVATPSNGDSAIVRLSDGTTEYYTHDGTSWTEIAMPAAAVKNILIALIGEAVPSNSQRFINNVLWKNPTAAAITVPADTSEANLKAQGLELAGATPEVDAGELWKAGTEYKAGETFNWKVTQTTAVDIDGKPIVADILRSFAYRVDTTAGASTTLAEIAKWEQINQQDVLKLRSAFQPVPSDDEAASEKLIKDSLDKRVAKPVASTQGFVATVDATGNDIEWLKQNAALANHILRPNATENVSPTTTEHPAPKRGDTAIILLNGGVIEYWTFTDVWAKDYSKSESSANQYVGAGTTFAGLPTARQDASDLVAGDRAWLSVDDGANKQGMYFTDGTAWTFGYTFDTGVATRVFASADDANAATIQPNQIVIVGTPTSNYMATWVHSGTTAKKFNSGDADFTMIAMVDTSHKEIWAEKTAFKADDEVVAIDPEVSSATHNQPRIYKANTDRPDTILAFDETEKANWTDIGSALLNSHGGVLKYLTGTQYTVDALNVRKYMPTFFESITGEDQDCTINANTSFNKKVYLDGVPATTPVTVTAKKFMIWRDYEKSDEVNGETRIITFKNDASGLRDEPVADLAALKALAAKDYERRLVKDTKREYVFKLTADLTAEEAANTDNIDDDAATGKWVLQNMETELFKEFKYKIFGGLNSGKTSNANESFFITAHKTIYNPYSYTDAELFKDIGGGKFGLIAPRKGTVTLTCKVYYNNNDGRNVGADIAHYSSAGVLKHSYTGFARHHNAIEIEKYGSLERVVVEAGDYFRLNSTFDNAKHWSGENHTELELNYVPSVKQLINPKLVEVEDQVQLLPITDDSIVHDAWSVNDVGINLTAASGYLLIGSTTSGNLQILPLRIELPITLNREYKGGNNAGGGASGWEIRARATSDTQLEIAGSFDVNTSHSSTLEYIKWYKAKKTIEKVDPTLVPVEDVQEDEIKAVNIKRSDGEVVINFTKMPDDLLVYGDGFANYGDYSNVSFKDLKESGTLKLGITGRSDSSDAAADSSEIYHIMYKIRYISDTSVGIDIIRSGYTEKSGDFAVRSYYIRKVIARYKISKSIIKPSDAIVPAGYEVQVIEGTFDGGAAEDITITVPAGKKVLQTPVIETLNQDGNYLIGQRDSQESATWGFHAYMSTATNLRLEQKGSKVINSAYRMTITFINS